MGLPSSSPFVTTPLIVTVYVNECTLTSIDVSSAKPMNGYSRYIVFVVGWFHMEAQHKCCRR